MARIESDHTIHTSMTDLMVSLVFIFILLLVVFLNNAQSESEKLKSEIKEKLKQELVLKELLENKDILDDPEDPLSTIIRLHESKLQFPNGGNQLGNEGRLFLGEFFPKFISIIHPFKNDIESINIEGFTSSLGDDLHNMHLSEERAFNVFDFFYQISTSIPEEQKETFLHFTTTRGWGERKLLPYVDKVGYSNEVKKYLSDSSINPKWEFNRGENEDQSRRVEIKIRVKSIEQREAEDKDKDKYKDQESFDSFITMSDFNIENLKNTVPDLFTNQ